MQAFHEKCAYENRPLTNSPPFIHRENTHTRRAAAAANAFFLICSAVVFTHHFTLNFTHNFTVVLTVFLFAHR